MGGTIETPGMVRWEDGGQHYFLKRIGTTYEVMKHHTFVLGREIKIGPEQRYEFATSIEFSNSNALVLLDQIAKFNGMPTYTAQLQRWALIEDLLDRMETSGLHSKADLIKKIRTILKETK